jgi:hypothetical protein
VAKHGSCWLKAGYAEGAGMSAYVIAKGPQQVGKTIGAGLQGA